MDISGLGDADLAQIFQHLPPFERLIVSEVCRRWYSANPSTWVDVTHLDLSPIPSANIGAIVMRCPNLQSVFAAQKSFAMKALFSLCKAPLLTSVKFYGCSFEADETSCSVVRWFFENMFSDSVMLTSWRELVMQKVYVVDLIGTDDLLNEWSLIDLPVSLTRLQLGGFRARSGEGFNEFELLEPLRNLECLIMQKPANGEYPGLGHGTWRELGNLKRLKELSLSAVPLPCPGTQLSDFVAKMPQLKVLFLNDVGWIVAGLGDLAGVITRPSALRVLVISGSFETYKDESLEIPARVPFPNGFGHAPLGVLNICLGQAAAEKMLFADSALVNKILINQPMPEFLEREDVKQIFEGVWIAEQIIESARNGGSL